MAIDPAEILVKRSTGSATGSGNAATATAAQSLGGQMSSSQITTATLNELFDDVSGSENAASEVEYRCFYFHNSDAALSLTGSRVYLSGETAGGAGIAIALDTIGPVAFNSASPMADTVADENTAPSPALTFSSPTNYAGGLVVGGDGIVGPNEAFAVWVRRTAANSAALDPDGVVIRLEGDTLP
jgi:hypothetical protein